jgi:hypothetical protein
VSGQCELSYETSSHDPGNSLSQSARGNPAAAFFRSRPAMLRPRVDGAEWFGVAHRPGGVGQSERGRFDHQLVQWIPPFLQGESRSRAVPGSFPSCPGQRTPAACKKSNASTQTEISAKIGLGLCGLAHSFRKTMALETRLDKPVEFGLRWVLSRPETARVFEERIVAPVTIQGRNPEGPLSKLSPLYDWDIAWLNCDE